MTKPIHTNRKKRNYMLKLSRKFAVVRACTIGQANAHQPDLDIAEHQEIRRAHGGFIQVTL